MLVFSLHIPCCTGHMAVHTYTKNVYRNIEMYSRRFKECNTSVFSFEIADSRKHLGDPSVFLRRGGYSFEQSSITLISAKHLTLSQPGTGLGNRKLEMRSHALKNSNQIRHFSKSFSNIEVFFLPLTPRADHV